MSTLINNCIHPDEDLNVHRKGFSRYAIRAVLNSVKKTSRWTKRELLFLEYLKENGWI